MELSSPRKNLSAVQEQLANLVNSIPTLPSHPIKYRDGSDEYYISYDIYVRSLIWCQHELHKKLSLHMAIDDYDGYELFEMIIDDDFIAVKNSEGQIEWEWDSSNPPDDSLYVYLNNKLFTTRNQIIIEISNDAHALVGVVSKLSSDYESGISFGVYDPHGKPDAQETLSKLEKSCRGDSLYFINMCYQKGLQLQIYNFDVGLCMLACLFWLACYMKVRDILELHELFTIDEYLIDTYNPLQLYHIITSFAMSKISLKAELFQMKDLHACVKRHIAQSRSSEDKETAQKLQQKYTFQQEFKAISSRRRSSLFDNISQSRSSNDTRDTYHDRFFLRPFNVHDKIYPAKKEIWLHVLWPADHFAHEFVMIYYRYDNVSVNPQNVRKNGLMLRLDPSYVVPCLLLSTDDLQLGDCNATCLIRKHLDQLFKSVGLYMIYGDAQTRMNYIRTWASAPVIAISVSYIRNYLDNWKGLMEYLSAKETQNYMWVTFRFSESSPNDPNPEFENEDQDNNNDLLLDIPDNEYKRTGNVSTDALLTKMEERLLKGHWVWTGASVLENGHGLILICKHRHPISRWIENELVQFFSLINVTFQVKDIKNNKNVVLPESTSVDVLAQRLKNSFMYNGYVPRLEENLTTKKQLQSVLWKIIKTWKKFRTYSDWIYPTFSSEVFVRWCWNQDSGS